MLPFGHWQFIFSNTLSFMVNSNVRCRNWVFTVNSPNPPHTGLLTGGDHVKFYEFQLEVGDSGTQHYQGYILFSERKSFAQAKAAIAPRAHIERMQGTVEESRVYCTKEPRLAGPWSFGTRPVGCGTRTDLADVRTMIDDGKSDVDIAETCFATWCRYYRAFAHYRLISTAPRYFKFLLESPC